jgi:hypothetical protein
MKENGKDNLLYVFVLVEQLDSWISMRDNQAKDDKTDTHKNIDEGGGMRGPAQALQKKKSDILMRMME